MLDRIDTADARPATAAELSDATASPAITSLIRVSPSREKARGLSDRMRVLSGGDPRALVGPRGIAVTKQYGLAGAIAIGWSLRRYRTESSGETIKRMVPADAVLASDDLGSDVFDPDVVTTDRFAWDTRALAFSTIGMSILDGCCSGPEWPIEAKRDAHAWAEDMVLIAAES